jgi:pilus assembly protein CpaD
MMRTDDGCRSHGAKRLRRAASLAVTLALAVTVLGCDEHGRLSNRMALSLNDPEKTHPIGFSARTESLLIQLPPSGGGLSHNQFSDIYRFAKRFRAESNDRLVVSVPGSSIRDGVASSRALDDVRQALREAEIDERRVEKAHHTSTRPLGPALRLSYLRPIAIAPECGLWHRDVGFEPERVPYPQFGCSTQRNTAGMVANARDLQRPQEEDPSSSERRSALWSKYAPPPGSSADPAADATKAKAPSTTGVQK